MVPASLGPICEEQSYVAQHAPLGFLDRREMSHFREDCVAFQDHPLMESVDDLPPNLSIWYDPDSHTESKNWMFRQASEPVIIRELYERKINVSTLQFQGTL